MKIRMAALVGLAAILLAAGTLMGGPRPVPKVVVLGFDGADPALIRRYMAQGDLPNLSALAKQGTFQDLEVTNPPQTPVSWGTFTTGLNPGRDRVFDFLVRDPKTYKPAFALMEEGSRRFMLGDWNRWVLPLLPLIALPCLAGLISLALRRRISRQVIFFSGLAGWPP